MRPFLARYLILIAASASAASAQRADTVRVRADGPPAWGPSARLVRLLSIGKLDGPPEYAFGSVKRVASLTNGAFFVYDGKDTVIRRYDAAGKYLGRIGRSGAGPGEFREILGMEVIGDSILAVWDPRNARVTLFTAAGQLRSSFTPALSGYMFADGVFVVDDRGLLGIMNPDNDAMHAGKTPVKRWIRFNLKGTAVDTVGAGPDSSVTRGFVLNTSDGARWSFGERVKSVLAPFGGSVTMWTSPYRFAITAANGRVILVERSWTPLPLGGEERAEWLAFAKMLGAPPPSGRAGPGVVSSQPARPDFVIPTRKPAIRDVFADRFDRVWVEVFAAADKRAVTPSTTGRSRLSWYDPTTYDLFDRSGRFLARLVLPPKSQVVSVQRDRVWLLVKGADDEDVVEVFRIDGAR